MDLIVLNVVKHNPFHGSSYNELPASVKNSKSVINIKNTDHKCFLYSILASRHEIVSHPERVSHYEKFINELQWKETDFPMAINKIPYFEKKNNIKVNVYAIDKDSVTSKISLNRSKSQNTEEINLFLHDKHYSYIKNWSRFSGGKQEHVCPNCFWKHKNDQCYKRHLENCHKLNENGSMVIMPKDKLRKNKVTGKEFYVNPQTMFSDHKKQKQVPVVMYADFECNLEPFHASPDKTKSLDTNNRKGVLAVHKPNTFRLHIETKLDLGIELDYVYTGEDCDLKFIDLNVNKLEQKIQDNLKACCDRHPTPVLTEMEEIDFQKQKLCIFCKKKFNENRVRDHDHYTGKYEGGAHQFCNVKAFQMFKGKANIPIVFHNANYDIKCFMSAFQKLKGDDAVIENIGGIPCNMEIFKSININSYSIIDSYAHLSSSLDKLLKNLPSEKKVLLRTLASNDEEFALINKKGFYPSELIT